MFGLFVRIYRLEKSPPDPSDDCAQNVALTVLRERRGVCRRIVSEHFHQREDFHRVEYVHWRASSSSANVPARYQ